MLRAPPQLRFVLAARHDVRLGLHRLRLEGGLTEIRAADLRFSLAEAGELFAAAGIELPGAAVVMLHERTEGWAAGLRLAALSLAGHPDPGRFAAEFSGSERTVAEYLLAEVLDRQGEQVRRLLLRTSVLERVNGELADLLAGGSSGERVLQDLEQANAFVVSLDAARSWFRYHQMFAGLTSDPAAVVAREWHDIAGRMFPGAVITDRSALTGGPVGGVLYLAHDGRARSVDLPGLRVTARPGAGPPATPRPALPPPPHHRHHPPRRRAVKDRRNRHRKPRPPQNPHNTHAPPAPREHHPPAHLCWSEAR